MENVAYVAYVAGSFDIIIEAFLPHTEGLFKFLNEDLDRIDGIASTETWNVLRTEKFFYNWEGEDVGLGPPATDGSWAERRRAPPRCPDRRPSDPGDAGAPSWSPPSSPCSPASPGERPTSSPASKSRRSTAWTAALGGQVVASLALIALLLARGAGAARAGRPRGAGRRRRHRRHSASSWRTGRSRSST